MNRYYYLLILTQLMSRPISPSKGSARVNLVARVASRRRRRVKSYYGWARWWVTSDLCQCYSLAYRELLKELRKSHLTFSARFYSAFISTVYRFILMKEAAFMLS